MSEERNENRITSEQALEAAKLLVRFCNQRRCTECEFNERKECRHDRYCNLNGSPSYFRIEGIEEEEEV